MKVRVLLSAVLMVAFSAGCGLPGTSDERLNREECRAMLTYLDQAFARKLRVQTKGVDEQQVEECVSEQNWSRHTYECIMKAKTKAAMDQCILRS